jgi:hypothetical protein
VIVRLDEKPGLSQISALNCMLTIGREIPGLSQGFLRAAIVLYTVGFQTLLTFCSPKRHASRLFWWLTVQPPEKPKPFLSHSIASKPAIVRRAVLKDWTPPVFGMFFFTRKWSLSMPC